MDVECGSTIECSQGAIRAARFNVNGDYILTCGSTKTLKLWNPINKLLLKTYAGHANEVLDAAASCDNNHLISCGADKSVMMWDVVKGQILRRLRKHVASVTCIAYNEESTVAVSGSQDNTVMCWDVRAREFEPVQILKEATDCITKVRVTDHEIITSSLDRQIRRYDIRIGKIIVDYIGAAVTCISLTADGQCILASCADDSIKLFDNSNGQLLGEYTGHKTGGYYVESCIDHTDSYVLSGSTDGCIWCWDLVKGEPVKQLTHAAVGKPVHSVVAHPTKTALLSASGNNVKYWCEKCEEDE